MKMGGHATSGGVGLKIGTCDEHETEGNVTRAHTPSICSIVGE